MKAIIVLLMLSGLPALATPNNDHLTLSSAVNAKEVKTYHAPRSVTFLPGFSTLSGSVIVASAGSAAAQSMVTIGKYGEELVRPIRVEEPPRQPAPVASQKESTKQ